MASQLQDQIVEVSEGNPGALTALDAASKELQQPDFRDFLDELQQMNITGPRVWLAFNDHCEHDVNCFVDSVRNKNQKMIDLINEQSYDGKSEVPRN